MQDQESQSTTLAFDLHVRSNLNQMFGGPFQIFQETNSGWIANDEFADGNGADILAGDEKQFWFTDICRKAISSPYFRTNSSGQLIMAVLSESEEGDVRIICGPVSCTVEQMATQLLSNSSAHYELQEKQKLLEAYANRLTDSYEELTFLRGISNHFVFRVANHALKDVCNDILPRLRAVLSVESVLFVGPPDASQPSVAANSIVAESGWLPCAPEEIVGIVCSLRPCQTLVYNHQRPSKRFSTSVPSDIKSLAIVPVEKAGQRFGWLIAINKVVDFCQTYNLGEDELGTIEGSLLEAAASMLATQAANNRLYQEKEELIVDVIQMLVGVIESRDQYTCGHSDRVALYAHRIALQLGLSRQQCQEVFLGGLLHDIGKVGVSDDVLLKPGRLTEEEFAEIQKHPRIGAKLLQGMKPFEPLIPVLLSHHESMDGSGYPDGLKGDQIPMLARIVAVADAYDAMTSNRPYRRGMEVGQAVGILQAGAGKQWDPRVVDALLDGLDDIQRVSDSWESHLQQLLDANAISGGSQKRDTASFVAVFGDIDFVGAPTPTAELADPLL